jgi:hypothetical protein
MTSTNQYSCKKYLRIFDSAARTQWEIKGLKNACLNTVRFKKSLAITLDYDVPTYKNQMVFHSNFICALAVIKPFPFNQRESYIKISCNINIYYNYTMHLYLIYFCMPIKCGQNYEKLVVPYKI